MTNSISIELTDEYRQQAYVFARKQRNQKRAEEVYRNTLVVLATKNFLDILGINNDLSKGFSWNFLGQQIGDIADLYLPDFKQSIECRVIRKTESKCHIPQEVQSDRLGYLFIELDDSYETAEIIGFVPQVSVSELPRSYFQGLDLFLEHLDKVSGKSLISIGELMKGYFQDWMINIQTIQTLLDNIQYSNREQFRLTFKSVEDEKIRGIEEIKGKIEKIEDDNELWEQGQKLWRLLSPEDHQYIYCPKIAFKDLTDYVDYPVALMVGIMKKPNSQKLLIMIRVFPPESQQLPTNLLPQGIKLTITDLSDNEIIKVVESQEGNIFIQYKFLADLDDKFSVGVEINNQNFTQEFLV
ncbi:DUF1822 family protein [Cylindrospermopsis raciborskii CS-506_D]|uniref:DUF1822 family protein n=1 Tax=Cylindrospermopsis raciborskii CS-506_A TaxID=2585140 RepID=A0A838WJR7_9CYAN|nr:DUF1822 family protein [Cylindrospermopsis raciborskii]MBA4445655.1 DUF1822 family protein [Cylindrospermopsis raciborskii CS-506_C]MBA4449887.1 DUF1822 family protein [Cylindrospermopsis raciborskii CS-506_D]MBA4456506.1 DUF1822 family protein [Cylindrospermopsis raciborskii CS-506_B]MBA4465856.1 DUF1822 family protein [Cylindrospermopsis raciborskii CS-506_A]